MLMQPTTNIFYKNNKIYKKRWYSTFVYSKQKGEPKMEAAEARKINWWYKHATKRLINTFPDYEIIHTSATLINKLDLNLFIAPAEYFDNVFAFLRFSILFDATCQYDYEFLPFSIFQSEDVWQIDEKLIRFVMALSNIINRIVVKVPIRDQRNYLYACMPLLMEKAAIGNVYINPSECKKVGLNPLIVIGLMNTFHEYHIRNDQEAFDHLDKLSKTNAIFDDALFEVCEIAAVVYIRDYVPQPIFESPSFDDFMLRLDGESRVISTRGNLE